MVSCITFKDVRWHPSYKTSSLRPDGSPVDILHDFYIPVLKIAIKYDRIAGFFRSSSLAIASQGFSAFTNSDGRMRLVVGADLAPQDVAAILEGDRLRLEARLCKELEDPENWPDEVTRGVSLLAWMVARGNLDVKVAFRIHGTTGKPIPIDSAEDGYVHEKWAVFTDREGNRIYISGSLNESRTALALNAENIDVHCDWWNDLERKRAEDALQDFETVWDNRSPYLRVMPLPEAVRQRLISFAKDISTLFEVDGSTAARPNTAPPSAMERLRFALVKYGPQLPEGGRFAGMETAPVVPWPHQEVVARRLVNTWPFSWLLCDEVGLGKTIEAGLAIRSLVLSGLARRVLIAAPANLVRQWQREMASKFLLSFGRALSGPGSRHEYIFPDETILSSSGIYSPDLSIVSTGLMTHKGREGELKTTLAFDITLVDEAHYARRQNPAAQDNRRVQPRFGKLYKSIKDVLRAKSRSLWLATATPMQLDWIEVYDLIRLTNRTGAFQDDSTLVWGYYQLLGRFLRGDTLNRQEWEFIRQVIRSIDYHDPFLKKYIEDAVINGRIRTAARQLKERGRIPRGSDLKNIRRLIFAIAPLSRVMLRHTRPLLEIYREQGKLNARLARRVILPIPNITFTQEEQRAYDALEEFCSGLARQIRQSAGDRQVQTSLKFLLSLLRLRFASSIHAITETVKRRMERVEHTLSFHEAAGDPEFDNFTDDFFDEEDAHRKIVDALLKNRSREDLEWERENLEKLLEILTAISSRPSKIQTLLDILAKRQLPGGRLRQTVIFTRFYDTLTDIVGHVRRINPSMLIGTYSGRGGQFLDPATGRLKSVDREEVKHRFIREEIDVLVCTDAAAEGLNLQTADLLINFDLPWNPMKVEQRIGRIDRIGQKHDKIFVQNLCYVGSVEEIVYGRLLQRLAQAGDVVGTQQVSILPVYEDDFQKLAEGKLSEAKLERLAIKRIERQQQQTATMEIPARTLYDIYMRMGNERRGQKSPVGLDDIWSVLCSSAYLRQAGCEVSRDEKIMTVRGIKGVRDGTLLTADRDLFERGIQGCDAPLHFASYGDPVFDAILEQVNGFGLPACVARLSVVLEKFDAEVVAFLAAVRNEKGEKGTRLICSFKDLRGIELDEDCSVTDSQIQREKKELEAIVREEFMPLEAVERIEKDNILASKAQTTLSMVTGYALLNELDVSDNEQFWPLVKILDRKIEGKEVITVSNLWAEPLRQFSGNFLFKVSIPALGNSAKLEAPGLMAMSAVDTCCRIAGSIRRKKSEITIGEVLDRLERHCTD